MAKTGRESGTGQDTLKWCVHVPPRFPATPSGHGRTLSRPVPLSRIGCSWLRRYTCLLDRPPWLLALGVLNHQEAV
jgi:hypothetical protein